MVDFYSLPLKGEVMVVACAFREVKEFLSKVYAFESHLAKNFSMLLNEAVAVCALGEGTAKRSTDIANEMGVTYSLMSRTLASLERKSLVTRAIGVTDKREMRFTLTKMGKETLAKITESYDFRPFRTVDRKKRPA
jgi:DNA-binding MarR family transcriptional regulator